MIIICVIFLSSVSAEEIDTNSSLELSDQIQIESSPSLEESKLEVIDDENEVPDVPDLIFNDTIYNTAKDLASTCAKKLALESMGINQQSQSDAVNIINNLKNMSAQ